MKKWILCSLFLASCSTRSSDTSFESVRQVIEERISKQMVWREGVEEIKQQFLQEIEKKGLTQENGVQLALVNNPELFAYYEDLEIGYADLLEAGLMQNPFFSASVGFPNKSGYVLSNVFDAAISFLDLFLIPFRKKAAEAAIKVIESQIGQKVLDLVQEVQVNWLEVKSLDLQLAEEKKLVELSHLAASLAKLQNQAGNISALQAKGHEIQHEEAVEKFKGFEAELEMAREKMNRLLGVFGNEAHWKIAGEIDWKNDIDLPDLNTLEKAAIENRLDIETIRRETDAIAQKAKLKEWWTYSNLLLGVSSEKQPEGFTTIGPSISLEVPIFNHGQGAKKRYHAELEQNQKKLLSKAVHACSEVREFFKTASKYQSQLKDFEGTIFPNLQEQLILGQLHYNVMTLGIYDLLELKANEVRATIEHIHALQLYKKARIDLLYAVGGSVDLLRKQE